MAVNIEAILQECGWAFDVKTHEYHYGKVRVIRNNLLRVAFGKASAKDLAHGIIDALRQCAYSHEPRAKATIERLENVKDDPFWQPPESED